LSPAIVVWRAAHGLVAIGFLASIGYVWWCALTGRRGPFLRPAITALVCEGVVVIANRGNCPLGPAGDRIGDPVPLFELVLSRRAASLRLGGDGGGRWPFLQHGRGVGQQGSARTRRASRLNLERIATSGKLRQPFRLERLGHAFAADDTGA
jgi:hypothetical protein